MSGFKGTLSNEEACEAVAAAIRDTGSVVTALPIGDGGAGSLQCVRATLGGDLVSFTVTGPLGKPVSAKVLCLPNATCPTSLYVESSEACGYSLVPAAERDVMRASSRGLGELLKLAYDRFQTSVKKIYVGLGDSAISDAGMGMLTALGITFLDQVGRPLVANAEALRLARSIRLPEPTPLANVRFTILCDVVNPLCGPSGSARIFSPQKGASPSQVKLIEQGMENFAELVRALTGREIAHTPMSGSAGGLSSAFLAFFRTELVQGARFLFDWVHFDDRLREHQAVFTGEGKSDAQSLSGKAPGLCAEKAKALGKPCFLISGALSENFDTIAKQWNLTAWRACGSVPDAKTALRTAVTELLRAHDFSI
jgi:glycerate kinase